MLFSKMNEAAPAGPLISVVIPNLNGEATIGRCLESVYASDYRNFEVIVVDDCSDDGSAGIIEKFPCRLMRLPARSGASRARNTGAESSRGEAIFFTDADCVLGNDTLAVAAEAFTRHPDAVTGGTYAPLSHDRRFLSDFQSVFVNYSETKAPVPDYVATHAMVLGRRVFADSGGFAEDFLPILEDVEFSHRLKRRGVRLHMEPRLVVEHVFDYSLGRSLKNAFRKSLYWTMYSLWNKDLARDSGTASVELKADVLSWAVCLGLLVVYALSGLEAALVGLAVVCGLNLFVNRRFIRALRSAGGLPFAAASLLYYTALYPAAVGAGGLVGALRTIWR